MLARATTTIFVFLLLASGIAAQSADLKAPLSLGTPGAKNKIEIFYDLQCGACASYHERLKKVVELFPDKVFVTIRHFPLPMHDRAFMASSAVEAAKRQGKGLEMVDLLLSEQSKWSVTKDSISMVVGYAKRLGLDAEKFRKDSQSDEVILAVVYDHSRAKTLGVDQTPTIYLNGKRLIYSEALELEDIISKGN